MEREADRAGRELTEKEGRRKGTKEQAIERDRAT
jgi:hypothetical protein